MFFKFPFSYLYIFEAVFISVPSSMIKSISFLKEYRISSTLVLGFFPFLFTLVVVMGTLQQFASEIQKGCFENRIPNVLFGPNILFSTMFFFTGKIK